MKSGLTTKEIFFGTSNGTPKEIPKPEKSQASRPFSELTDAEQQAFAKVAISESQKFVDWSTNTIEANKERIAGSRLADQWKHAPSKKLFLATLGTIGLANIGLTAAAIKHYMSPFDVYTLWDGTMGSIFLEELVFRSRKIPDLIQSAGKSMGFKTRPDTARRIADMLFAGIHPMYLFAGRLEAYPMLFLGGGTATKMAHEKGLLASITLHSVYNALNIGYAYLFEGSVWKALMGVKGTGGILPENKYTKILKSISTISLIGLNVGIGIAGIKEMIEDKKVTDTLIGIRNAPTFVDQKAMAKTITDLLKHPSTEGYKFQAGVELAYLNARLSMPESAKRLMSDEQFARHKVRQYVTETSRDPKMLEYRLQKAFAHIDNQLNQENG